MTRLLSAIIISSLLPVPALAMQDAGRPAATIPFELHRNKILLPVTIDGQGPLWFVLDTGAPVMVLTSRETAAGLGLEVQGQGRVSGAGEGAALTAGFTSADALSVGNISLGPSRLIVVDLAAQLASASGRLYHGIIGRPLFDRYVVRIDFSARRLELYEPATYEAPERATVIPIRLENGHPHFDTRVTTAGGDQVEVDLVIDTGARTALMLDATPGTSLVPPPGAVEMIIGHGARGPVRGQVAPVAAVALGDITLRNVQAAFAPDAVGVSPGADGNLGAEVLRRFTVTFDYRRSRMILESGRGLDDPYPVDLSGITFRAGGDDWRELSIGVVRDGSPAMRAGLQAGDRIVGVNGRPAPELEALERRFEESGRVTLDLLRDGRRVQVRLELP